MNKLSNKKIEVKLRKMVASLKNEVPNHLSDRTLIDCARVSYLVSLQMSKCYHVKRRNSAVGLALKDAKITTLFLLFANQKGYRWSLEDQKARLLSEY